MPPLARQPVPDEPPGASPARGGAPPAPQEPESRSELGATWDGEATTFVAWSSVATAMDLCLFETDGVEARVPMVKLGAGTWQVRVPAGPGQRYGYRVNGPWDASFAGPLCDPKRLLLDPWARAIHGAPAWDAALFPAGRGRTTAAGDERDGRRRDGLGRDGRGSPSGVPGRTHDGRDGARRAGRDTSSFVPRSVVVDPAFDWTGDAPPRRPMAETVIYELHVKGFTRRHPGVPPAIRGTYLGLAHRAAIDHLLHLGVSAVELLPVAHFISEPRLAELGLVNYWGYNPIGFVAPHAGYAAGDDPGAAVTEFKSMVRSLHAAGLEVILDVVFNHTAEGGRTGPVLSLKGLDNAAYYRVSRSNPDAYDDMTACGNTLDARSPAVQRLVLESLRHWVREYHVDGFRFDLAVSLGRGTDGFEPDHPLLAAIRADPVVGSVKLIAEPWDLGPGGYQAGRFPAPWSEWNDGFRTAALDAWNGGGPIGGELARRLAGSPDRFRTHGRLPTAAINYVTSHDGMTLADLVSYSRKRNGANGEAGLDGADHDRSANHGGEGPTEDPAVQAARLRTRRNLLATLLLAQGVPMLLAGDELGRSQDGNNNAYCQDNETSWLDWSTYDPEFLSFVRSLVALRAARPTLRNADWTGAAAWQTLDGAPASPEAWPADADGLVLRLGASVGDGRRSAGANGSGPARRHCVVIQAAPGGRRVRLPTAVGVAGWRIILDTTAPDPLPAWGRTLVPGRPETVEGPGVLLCDGMAP